ncbi:MAG: hypothetical protein Q4G09_03880 [Clostridia bacterium]|nr:hypothetical protein [Clostridia bacterium]
MSKKSEAEELKAKEDEAYFELCKIIAEAMQIQDVNLLDSRIAYWKSKYKGLLSISASSTFKKRIEFLLNQYYSSITQYILSQIRFKEEKMISNQRKALRELYAIIRDTNDLALLKKKIGEWEKKYPVSGFLRMYQKRIKLYTTERNLESNAFNQDEAFYKLVQITKKNNLTLDELNQEIDLWKREYSIDDKYTIDDFIKNQSEVKRFVSDEYLAHIAKESLEPLSTQSLPRTDNQIIKALSTFPKKSDINKIFDWVYKNHLIEFDDEAKNQIICAAEKLGFSPSLLKSNNLSEVSKIIDTSNSNLSFEEYQNMSDIKKYIVITYFNLLLPHEQALSNNYFNNYYEKYIETINNSTAEQILKVQSIEDDTKEQPIKNITQQLTTSEPTQEIVEQFTSPEPAQDTIEQSTSPEPATYTIVKEPTHTEDIVEQPVSQIQVFSHLLDTVYEHTAQAELIKQIDEIVDKDFNKQISIPTLNKIDDKIIE